MDKCRRCGAEAPERGLREIRGYDWDAVDRGDDDEMTLSVMVTLGYECRWVTDCARRVVEQGTNVVALRAVARDYENLGELATQAREILRQLSRMSQEVARAEDAAAREMGYGVIGG